MARPDLIAQAALTLDGGDGAEADRLVRRLCEEVLRRLGPQPSSLRARVAAGLSRACLYLDDVDAAARASEQALAVANECDDRAAVVATLQARQLVRSDPDGIDERFELAAQLLEIGREASDPETQMWAHLWRIDVMFQRGDLAGIGRELDFLAWCVDEVGGPVARWQLLRCRAAHAQAQARFADAIRLANDGFTELLPLSAWVRDGVLAVTGHHIGHKASGATRAYGLDASIDARDYFPRFYLQRWPAQRRRAVSPAGRLPYLADPAAFFMVFWERQSQWNAIAKGQLVAWGRKPWLELKFRSLILNP